MSVLDRVVVVLYEPQDPVNIAATARAMKNMGVSVLRLVRPVPYEPERLEFVAHGTADLIAAAHARSGSRCGAGRLRRCRRLHRPAPRGETHGADAARTWHGGCSTTESAGPVAVLFGREDAGLPNAAVDRARAVCTIPTAAHSSLNLAQAVVIALYELHVAAGDATRILAPPRHDVPPASAAQFEQLFADASRALTAIDFYKTREREHVMRTVRSLASRAAPDAREIYVVASDVARGLANDRPLGHHTAHRVTL